MHVAQRVDCLYDEEPLKECQAEWGNKLIDHRPFLIGSILFKPNDAIEQGQYGASDRDGETDGRYFRRSILKEALKKVGTVSVQVRQAFFFLRARMIHFYFEKLSGSRWF